jgi:glutaredoxin 3
MRGTQIRSGHRLQLARALVQHQLDVRERLEPAAEARLRPPDALRDRADATTIRRVDVEDAVGLAEPERTEHDRFGSVRPRHSPSLELPPDGNRPALNYVVRAMSRIQIYTTRWCGYCVRAKALLDDKDIPYEEIMLDDDPAFRRTIQELTGGWTVPQILIDGQPIGGYTELWRLDKSGQLDARLAA